MYIYVYIYKYAHTCIHIRVRIHEQVTKASIVVEYGVPWLRCLYMFETRPTHMKRDLHI